MELLNIDNDVTEEMYKLASVNLCSNLDGQLMTGLMVNPPKPGSASYDQYIEERDTIIESMKRRAKMVEEGLNSMEGVSCQRVEGAMYAFPSITLPPAAVDAAKSQGKAPDVFYCLELLKATGYDILRST